MSVRPGPIVTRANAFSNGLVVRTDGRLRTDDGNGKDTLFDMYIRRNGDWRSGKPSATSLSGHRGALRATGTSRARHAIPNV